MLLFTVNLYSQEEKYIKYYNENEYEKAIKFCDKAISNNSKDLNAYLYKALCQAELSQKNTPGKTKATIESSLKTIIRIQKKDKDSTFLSENADKIALVNKYATSRANYYFKNNKCYKAVKIYRMQEKLFRDPSIFYYKAKCQLAIGDTANSMINFNNSAKATYLLNTDGKETDTILDKAFTNLALLLFDKKQIKEAFEITKRAIKVFPNSIEVQNTYYLLLKKSMSKSYLHRNYIGHIDLIKKINLGITKYPVDKRFDTLKTLSIEKYTWGVCNSYSKLDKKINNLKKLIESDNAKINTEIIRISLIKNCIEQIKNNKFEVNDKTKQMTKLLIEFEKYDKKISNDLAVFTTLINQLLDKNQSKTAGLLLANYYSFNKRAVNIEEKTITKVVSKYKNDNPSYNEWLQVMFWAKLFPDNNTIKSFQHELCLGLIKTHINENKFSSAGQILRYAGKTFPTDPKIKQLKKEWVVKDYINSYLTSNVSYDELKWTGSYDKCDAGKISSEAQKKTLKKLNYFRRLAGIPDQCVFDEKLNNYCQYAALIMGANSALRHNPPKSWKCYSELGYKGASNSNLSWGAHSSDAIENQIEDWGSGNYSVGHRRWILNPPKRVYGHGSTPSAMSLWALSSSGSYYPDSISSEYRKEPVMWPPADYVPKRFVFERWSFSLINANLENFSVSMSCNGKKINCRKEKYQRGYGQNTAVWVPEGLKISLEKETIISVRISNITYFRDDKTNSYSYQVIVLPSSAFKK